mgnify:CR=1 FL=1
MLLISGRQAEQTRTLCVLLILEAVVCQWSESLGKVTPVISDIGHSMANALKAEFEKAETTSASLIPPVMPPNAYDKRPSPF